MTKQEANAKIAELLKSASEAVLAAKSIADEAKVSFSYACDLGLGENEYGGPLSDLGFTYHPEVKSEYEGQEHTERATIYWANSSMNC